MNKLSPIRGTAVVLGNDINTDVIIPSSFLEDPNPREFSKGVLSDIRPGFFEFSQGTGDVIICAGKDFGSGSSREQAPDALKYAGVKIVVAESFSSIFFRNAVNIGLPILICKDIALKISEGDKLMVDIEEHSIINETAGYSLQAEVLEEFLLNKLRAGGLIPELQTYVREHGLD